MQTLDQIDVQSRDRLTRTRGSEDRDTMLELRPTPPQSLRLAIPALSIVWWACIAPAVFLAQIGALLRWGEAIPGSTFLLEHTTLLWVSSMFLCAPVVLAASIVLAQAIGAALDRTYHHLVVDPVTRTLSRGRHAHPIPDGPIQVVPAVFGHSVRVGALHVATTSTPEAWGLAVRLSEALDAPLEPPTALPGGQGQITKDNDLDGVTLSLDWRHEDPNRHMSPSSLIVIGALIAYLNALTSGVLPYPGAILVGMWGIVALGLVVATLLPGLWLPTQGPVRVRLTPDRLEFVSQQGRQHRTLVIDPGELDPPRLVVDRRTAPVLPISTSGQQRLLIWGHREDLVYLVRWLELARHTRLERQHADRAALTDDDLPDALQGLASLMERAGTRETA